MWYFAGWGWSLIPFLFGALQVFRGVSSTLTARKLQPLMPHKGTTSLVRALSPEIDLDDVLQVTAIDDIRQKYGALLDRSSVKK